MEKRCRIILEKKEEMYRLENIKIYEDLAEEDVLKTACKKYKIDYKNISYQIPTIQRISPDNDHPP